MNTLTKKVLAASALALLCCGAFADVDSYLYWMVDDSVTYWYGASSGTKPPSAYASVRYVGMDDGYLTWYNADGVTDGNWTKLGVNSSGGTQAAYWGLDSSLASLGYTSLIFELHAANGDLVGWWDWDGSVDISELSSYITSSTAVAPSGGAPYTIYGVVPEPTSGLLSLFGLAALALRRRRRHV